MYREDQGERRASILTCFIVSAVRSRRSRHRRSVGLGPRRGRQVVGHDRLAISGTAGVCAAGRLCSTAGRLWAACGLWAAAGRLRASAAGLRAAGPGSHLYRALLCRRIRLPGASPLEASSLPRLSFAAPVRRNPESVRFRRACLPHPPSASRPQPALAISSCRTPSLPAGPKNASTSERRAAASFRPRRISSQV